MWLSVHPDGSCCLPLEIKPDWSTSMSRNVPRSSVLRVFCLLLAGSIWHMAPFRANNPYDVKNQQPARGLWMPEQVLYGIRLLAQASLGKLSTNESRASTFLDQWEWTRLDWRRTYRGPGPDTWPSSGGESPNIQRCWLWLPSETSKLTIVFKCHVQSKTE